MKDDPTRTTEQPAEPDPTAVVANVLIDATAVGVPTVHTLARAHRPSLPGYELHEVVGKGGMGIVYRAKQVNLDRDIAIKFLRDDFHPRSATGLRFMEEARITAQLQHPGIPAVHEVGTLADDRPYLAMKLIRGRTLDALLKEQGPGTTKWLAVFEAVCNAVGYAHAHNVVHRDLKPSNIMVGAFGEVQVMDWGLAKVVGSRETQFHMPALNEMGTSDSVSSLRDSGSIQTRAGSYLGTPAFMAPEQATGDVEHMSPRTDVFGLGAVLCTLMTGHPPYLGVNSETTRLMAAATKLDECFKRLEATGAEPELIALCKRCLAATPADRFEDGTAVAKAIVSFRAAADERARQADLERARTEVAATAQAKRRRTILLFSGALSAVLLAGLILSSLSYFKELEAKKTAQKQTDLAVEAGNQKEEQRKIADENRIKAEQQTAVANSTLKFFLDDVLGHADATRQGNARLKSGANYAMNANATVRELLGRTAADSTPEAMETSFPNQPLTQARILRMLGNTYRGIGDTTSAVNYLERAYELYQKHAPRGPDDFITLETLNELALTNLEAGQTAKALNQFETLYDYRTREFGPNKLNTMVTETNVAIALLGQGQFDNAIRKLTSVRDRLVAYPKPEQHTDQLDVQAYVLQAEHNLGIAFHRKARLDIQLAGKANSELIHKAIRQFTTAYDGRVRLLKDDHPDTLQSLDNLAFAMQESGDIPNAIQLYEKVLATRIKARGEFHPQTLETRNKLASAYLVGGVTSPDRLKIAIRLFEELKPVCESKLGSDHIVTLVVRQNLAQAYVDSIQLKDDEERKRLPEAIRLLEEVRKSFERILPLDHNDRLQNLNTLGGAYFLANQFDKAEACFAVLLAASHRISGPFKPDQIEIAHSLASMHKQTGKKDECVKLHKKTMELLQEGNFQHPDAVRHVIGLCNDFEEMGLWADAEPWRKKVLEILERDEGDATESGDYSRNAAYCGRNLLKQQKWAEAAKPLKRAWEIRRKHEQNKPTYFNSCSAYGEALFGEKKYDEAGPLLIEGYEGLKAAAESLPANSRFIVIEAGQRLLAFYVATKQDAKAAELRKDLNKD